VPVVHRGVPVDPPVQAAGARSTRLDNVAVMRQAIEKRCCHFGVAKYCRPFTKGEIGVTITEVCS
jgi:hypothetical protein